MGIRFESKKNDELYAEPRLPGISVSAARAAEMRGNMMSRPVLLINACTRENSRTRKLAEKVVERLELPFEEIRLNEVRFPLVDEAFLSMRDRLVAEGDLGNPVFDLARRFAEAETVVIAAPYWDLSFPAVLKQYFEQVNVVGITFRYTEEGVPVGLCRAERIIYVTTAGGSFVPEEFGYGYVKALAQGFYGISDVRIIKAVGLDLAGADVNRIMESAEESIAEIIG